MHTAILPVWKPTALLEPNGLGALLPPEEVPVVVAGLVPPVVPLVVPPELEPPLS